MATKPQTNEEALQQINEKQDKLRADLKDALANKDSKKAQQLYDDLSALEAQKRSMAKFLGVPIGAIGSGLQSNLKGVVTFPLDLPMMLRNLATGEGNQMPSEFLGGLFKDFTGAPALNIQDQPASMESAVPFRAAQGFTPGGGAKMLAATTALGAADAAMGDDGMLQLGFGAGLLTAGGIKALKGMRDNSRMKAFVKGLPSAEGNAFSKFMMTGQGSDDPMVNAALQRLANNPEYSELFAKLRRGATEAATAGMQPAASKLSETEATTAAVTGIAAKIKGLKEAMTTAPQKAFERAYGYAGDKPLVSPSKTLQAVRDLKEQYQAKGSPDSEKAVALLQQLEDKLAPKGAIPGAAGRTVVTQRAVTGRDAAGMPTTSYEPMTVNVPGSKGYEFSYGERKLTVPEIQGWLSEFGAKASSEGALFPELSLPAQDRIMKTVFGSLKDDLRVSVGATDDVLERKALSSLMEARKATEQAATSYNNAVAQGLPAWLKNKPLNTITPEELFSEYNKLNKGQRDVVRQYLSGVDDEALKFIDRKVYDDFVATARAQNPDGTYGTNLEKLAQKWATLKAADKDAVSQALGTNAAEFDKRMKDAEVFSRKMQVNQPAGKEMIPNQQVADVEAVVGAAAGYSPAKITRTALQAINIFGDKPFSGLSDEQLLKALLTKEGKEFLKQGSLNPRSAKTLEALTQANNAALPAYVGARLLSQQQQQPEAAPQQQQTPALEITPEDIITDTDVAPAPTTPATAPQQKPITLNEEDLVLQ